MGITLQNISLQYRIVGQGKDMKNYIWIDSRVSPFQYCIDVMYCAEDVFWEALEDYKTWALKDLTATKTLSEKQLWYHRSQRHSSLFKWMKTTSAVWFHYHSALLWCFPRHWQNSIELILRETLHSPVAQTSNDPLVFALLLLKKALNFHSAAASSSLWRWH